MEKIPMIVICALSLFITSTYCCLLSGSGGSCLTYGLSFGGRIHFPDGAPDYLSCNGESGGQKIIIFQRPRTFGKGKSLRSMFGGFGVGRIWMSDQNTCQKPAGDSNLECPPPESQSIPCFDKSIPCHLDLISDCNKPVVPPSCGIGDNLSFNCTPTIPPVSDPSITGYVVEYHILNDPTNLKREEYTGTEPMPLTGPFEQGYIYEYWIRFISGGQEGEREGYGMFLVPCRDVNLNLQLSTSSQRTGMASLVADWDVGQSAGQCSVASKTITVKQMDWNNCAALRNTTLDIHELNDDDRSYRLRKKHPNIEYSVSVTVGTKYQEFTASQVIRAQETVPSAHPSNVIAHSYKRSRQLDIHWEKPPCHTHHGRMKYYSVKMTREGVTRVHNVKGTRARYAGFSMGEKFTVQVAAINSHGMGPYCPKVVGMFGQDVLSENDEI